MNSQPWIPSDEEKKRVKETINELVGRLNTLLSSYNANVKPVGSTAKDTFLPENSDIDIYIVTDKYTEAYEVVRSFFPNGFRKYGQLLIWNIRYNGYDVDLVFVPPDFEKKDTLYHTDFFLTHLDEKARNEVRKAKAFFKSKGLYGAEIGGIIGVALEELVRRYGTLDNICRELISHDYGELWIQDPVMDRPRNLLASINREKWKRIQEACLEYLKTHKVEYKKYSMEDFINEMKNKGYDVILLCNIRKDKSIDYHTALSVCKTLCNTLRNIDSDVNCWCEAFIDKENVAVAVKVEPNRLPVTKDVCIPSSLPKAIEAFKNKHDNIVYEYNKDNLVCFRIPRRIRDPVGYVTTLIHDKMGDRGYSCKRL